MRHWDLYPIVISGPCVSPLRSQIGQPVVTHELGVQESVTSNEDRVLLRPCPDRYKIISCADVGWHSSVDE